MNTVLESLSYGVPLVAVPIGNDQPGVAARLVWTGAGEMIPRSQLRVSRLRAAIQRVLAGDVYHHHARRLRDAISRGKGLHRAAEIIETAAITKRPVLAGHL